MVVVVSVAATVVAAVATVVTWAVEVAAVVVNSTSPTFVIPLSFSDIF